MLEKEPRLGSHCKRIAWAQMQKVRKIRIATRASKLALWQANHVRDLLVFADPELQVELVTVVRKTVIVAFTPLSLTR